MASFPEGVFSGANFSMERLRSGGRTSMPMRWHSEMKMAILSVLFSSLESRPERKATGKFAFR